MFEDIDDKLKEDKSQGVDLLPKHLRSHKKKKSKKGGPDKMALHIPKEKIKDKRERRNFLSNGKSKKAALFLPGIDREKLKRQKSLLSKLANLFKPKPKPKKPAAILSMNVVEPRKDKPQVEIKKPPEFESKLDFKPLEKKPFIKDQPRPVIEAKDKPVIHKAEDKIPADKKSQPLFSQIKDKAEKEEKEDEIDVNLLPERKRHFTDKQIIVTYAMIIIVSLFVIVSPYVFYKSKNNQYQGDNIILNNQLTLARQKREESETQIKDYGALAFKLKHLKDLFDNHIYWSKFFPTLERQTIQNVYFISLAAMQDYQISLHGHAFNLRSLAEQLVVFKNSQEYSSAELESLMLLVKEEDINPGLEFSVNFIVNSDIVHDNNSPYTN